MPNRRKKKVTKKEQLQSMVDFAKPKRGKLESQLASFLGVNRKKRKKK